MSFGKVSCQRLHGSRFPRARLMIETLEGRTVPSFLAAPSYAVGGFDPQSVAVGDLNGDGIPDLAVGSSVGGITTTILLGKGDGSFQAVQNYPVGGAVALADFNQDGILDLVVVHPNLGARILLGNGDGSFQLTPNPVTVGTGLVQTVAVGDFNGDGKLDLALLGAFNDGAVHIALGNGDGTFQPAQSYAVAPNLDSLSVGDFNGDGRLDLVIGYTVSVPTSRAAIQVLLGNGDGTFAAGPTYSVGYDPVAMGVGDLNGDGIPDLAVATSYFGQVSIFLGNGDGTFQTGQTYATGPGTESLALADFNGDGHLDVAVSNGSGVVSMLLGQGDGTFRAPASNSYVYGAAALAVGDFNGDGHPDLVVTSVDPNQPSGVPNGAVAVLLGKGDGTFHAAQSYTVGLPYPDSIATADFNGDGILDLAVADFGDNTVSILLGNGDGTFQAPLQFSVGVQPDFVLVADFNGDGKLDLALTSDRSNGSVSILLGNGDGSFQPAQSYAVGAFPHSLAVGDFNGDGHLDLAVANQDLAPDPRTVSILLGNGDGSFQTAQTYPTGGLTPLQGNAALAVGDFNGDGRLDLIVTTRNTTFDTQGAVSLLLGNGDGTFQPAVTFADGTGPVFVAVGDFNGDGKLDFVTVNFATQKLPRGGLSIVENDLRVFLGNGDGTFQAPRIYTAGVAPAWLAVADVNGDGIPDLVVANGGNQVLSDDTVTVLLGNGDGTFRADQKYGAGFQADAVAVGDFNGDGYADVAVADSGSSTVTVLLNAADWGSGHAALPPGPVGVRPGVHALPRSEPISVLFATLQPPGLCPLLPQDPGRSIDRTLSWPLPIARDQPLPSIAALSSGPQATVRATLDAAWAQLDEGMLAPLAWNAPALTSA